MGAFENITDKIVLLLKKTKDALLLDLEKEFSSIRDALEKAAKDANSKDSPASFKAAIASVNEIAADYKKVIDAVFARVGVDLSQCQSINDLQTLIGRPLDLLEKLGGSLDGVTGKDGKVDYMKLFDALLATGKDILKLVEDFQKVEISKIKSELEDTFEKAYDDFDLEEFALSVLEHILITILKNGKDVFSDEIKYAQLQANNVYKELHSALTNVQNSVNDVRSQIESTVKSYLSEALKETQQAEALVKALFKETVQEMTDVYDAVAENAEQALKDARSSEEFKAIAEVYVKVSSAMAKVYAILDFMGIVGKKKLELKVPQAFIDKIQTA